MKSPSSAPTSTFGLEPAGYRQLLEQFLHARSILVYSGAGMSADSGLPTYRGEGEHLWTDDVIERVATASGFVRDPDFAVAWYIEQGRKLHAARPHAGHHALVALEQHWTVTHVTQNVDVLLEHAGCADIVHLHGRYDHLRCMHCSWHTSATHPDALRQVCPDCAGRLRPAIVWMGEAPDSEALARAMASAGAADLVLVVGTPAEMYPGAAVVEAAHRAGAAICVINPQWCENLHYAHWQLFAGARDALPALVNDAIARKQAEGKPLPWYLQWLPAWAK
ncbi:MAG TPA: Sir2 family NAD-dependent protein deacetylase [Noviherbaspirillum sp.]